MSSSKSFSATVKRRSGTVEIHRGHVRFIYDENVAPEFSISFSELIISEVGKNTTIIKLSHRFNIDLQILCNDEKIIKELKNLGLNKKTEIVSKNIFKRRLIYLSFFALPLFLLFLFPLFLKNLDSSFLDKIISHKQLEWLGENYLKSMVGDEKYSSDSPQSQGVEKLLKQLVEANPRLANIPIKFILAKSSQQNAFALPGAYIVVYDSFIKEARSIEEIYGVLAHELAHLSEQHITQNLLSNAGFLSGLIFFNILFKDVSFLGQTLFDLKNLSFSRELETEADMVALTFLQQAQISPQGLADFFERMSGVDTKADYWITLFSTHPSFKTRIEGIEAKIKDGPYNKKPKMKEKLENLKKLF